MRSRIFQIVQRARKGDHASRAYDLFVVCVAFASVVPTLFHADALPETGQFIVNAIDLVTVYILAFDYILRWMTHDLSEGRPGDWKAFARYPFTPTAIIDLLAILPSLNVLPAGFLFLRVLRIFRVFRYSRHLSIISNVFYQERRTLGLIMILACLYIFITSLIMFTLESDTFTDFVDALYWGTITLTTIGFGDIHPLTDVGRVITSISSLFGIFVLALPAGIMTGSFLKQLQLRSDDEKGYYSQTFVGNIDWKFFLMTPSRVKAFFARNPKVRLYLAFIFFGVGLDLLLCAICSEGFWQPIWLDTAGTAIVACALDPAAGIIVAYLNNLFLAVYTGNSGNLLYIGQSVIVALAYAHFMRIDENGHCSHKQVGQLMFYVIIVQAALSFALALLLNGGSLLTIFMQYYQATLMEWGVPFCPATFLALVIDRFFDSIGVFLVVELFRRLMKNPKHNPRRWLADRGLSEVEDLSQYATTKGKNLATRMDAADAAGLTCGADADDYWPDTTWNDKGPTRAKLISAVGMLEARAVAASPEDAQRYKAAVTALKLMNNNELSSEQEYARLFEALEFGRVGDEEAAGESADGAVKPDSVASDDALASAED